MTYRIVIEACDGRGIYKNDLTKEEAIEKASEWLGHPYEEGPFGYAVSDFGVTIAVESNEVPYEQG